MHALPSAHSPGYSPATGSQWSALSHIPFAWPVLSWLASPITRQRITDDVPAGRTGAPFTLLHGLSDEVVPVAASKDFAAALTRVGWPVELVEIAADHGSIAGAEYDVVADRYEPGQGEPARRVAAEVAARIAASLRRPDRNRP